MGGTARTEVHTNMSDDKNDMMDGASEKAAVDMADGRGGEGRGGRKGRRRKVSYLTLNKIDSVDYKDVNVLRRYLSADRGKILASRQTGNTAKQQRMIAQAIKRAREMALLPFVLSEPGDDRKPREAREAR